MKWKLAALCALLITLGITATAFAHGAKIEYKIGLTVEILAAYDSGEPMAGAQVAIYTPDNPSTPWMTGSCDEEGHFAFTPDTSKPGTWDVQVRQAGHGDIIHLPIGENMALSGATGYTTLQVENRLVVRGCHPVFLLIGAAVLSCFLRIIVLLAAVGSRIYHYWADPMLL